MSHIVPPVSPADESGELQYAGCPSGISRGYREIVDFCLNEPTLFIEQISLGSIKHIAQSFQRVESQDDMLHLVGMDAFANIDNDRYAHTLREDAKRIMGDWVVKVGNEQDINTGTVFFDSTKDIVLRTPGKIRLVCSEVVEEDYQHFDPAGTMGPPDNPLLSEFSEGVQHEAMERKMLERYDTLQQKRSRV